MPQVRRIPKYRYTTLKAGHMRLNARNLHTASMNNAPHNIQEIQQQYSRRPVQLILGHIGAQVAQFYKILRLTNKNTEFS